ncbi:MAG: FAD-dependent oxidoreductase [Polyangiaceae bacterium]
MGVQADLQGPDLEKDGVEASDLSDGVPVEGHVAGEAVIVVRRGSDFFAIGAHCSHYGGPLAGGLVSGDIVLCPWHHARFDLRSGEAVAAPALNPVPCWKVESKAGRIFVIGRIDSPARKRLPIVAPKRVVVVGAGAAGASAVESLRREGYDGDITLVGRDESLPVDRPNLSKDYLAGTAPEEWIPLRSKEFYAEQRIRLELGVEARAIDTKAKTVALSDGRALPYDALLLATGADPVRLAASGADPDRVMTLRSLADSRAIIARASRASRAVVVGGSFIALEVAASLRARGLAVDVVAPDAVPLGAVLGPEVGSFIRALHESKGVRFHLGRGPTAFGVDDVLLDDGSRLACDFAVAGAGVRPVVDFVRAAGIGVDQGVLTDEYLETDVPGVFAAGDIARYATSDGRRRRVEHWVHAERQGQVAAQNILGRRRKFAYVPFFWSAHYDVTISYVGYVERWDRVQVAGSLNDRDATIAYRQGGLIRAVATIGRDRASLAAEEAMERNDNRALEALLAS